MPTDPTRRNASTNRRRFLTLAALGLCSPSAIAEENKPAEIAADGGLAPLKERLFPKRTIPVLPPGGINRYAFGRRCTACALCVSACPNHVLFPQSGPKEPFQPEMRFEHGYCRPECVRCSQVCPSGAIKKMTAADKASTQIGYAVYVRDACIVVTDGKSCGNCARHCPTSAIELIALSAEEPDGLKVPTIDTDRCIGCGRCEYLCPARPVSAIYVEGVYTQRTV